MAVTPFDWAGEETDKNEIITAEINTVREHFASIVVHPFLVSRRRVDYLNTREESRITH
jgi:hypothetical protein